MIYLIPDPLNLVQVVDVKILCSNTPAKATISALKKSEYRGAPNTDNSHCPVNNPTVDKPDLQ